MKCQEIKINSWEELKNVISDYNPLKEGGHYFWCFRGQSNSEWGLTTTLERNKLSFEERKLVEKFKRNAHLYTRLNKVESTLEWLSLMQHHGSPTRLLDWTKSPYIAIFFCN